MIRLINKSMAVTVVLCLFLAGSALAQKMVLYPTDVSKAGGLAYLQDSVRLMLASKLASETGNEMRLEGKLDRERDFRSYRVETRLVSNAKGVEISATAYAPSANKPIQFKAVAANASGVIRALDLLVRDMEKTLFQKDLSPQQAATGGTKTSATGTTTTPHPDRAVKTNSGFGLSISQEAFAREITIDVESNKRYKSAVLSVLSKAMTAGDIDGDSLDEILIATNTRILIYQLKNGKIQELTTISLPGGLKVHGLSVADLNQNGIMEIYVSSTRDKAPRSFILEWSQAGGVNWLHENVYWYLRAMDVKGMGAILVGQKSGVVSMMQPGVYRLDMQSAEGIVAGERLAIPESVNIFDFVFADLSGDGALEVVALNKKEQLKVYDSSMELLYTSPAGFGGREIEEGYTAPIRLVVTDFNNDSKEDIVIVDNELYSPTILSKTRLYKNGQVRGLLWDGLGFMEMWHTNIFQKGVVDYQFLASRESGAQGANLKGLLFVVEPEKGDFLQAFLMGGGGIRLSAFAMDFMVTQPGQ